jgi:hypothetical protein
MKTIKDITLYPAKIDFCGNPRVIVHFLEFLKDSDEKLSIDEQYETAKKRAYKLGFKVYRGRDFGGGFIRQCWSESELKKEIAEFINNI